MNACPVSAGDFRPKPMDGEPVGAHAKSIATASEALLIEAGKLRTVNEALRLYHLVAGLRDRLDVIAGFALERADALCDAPPIIGRITPDMPWGES